MLRRVVILASALLVAALTTAAPSPAVGAAICARPRGCAALARLIASQTVPTQMITVENDDNLPDWQVHALERGLAWQSNQLHAWWGTPEVTFGPGGWPFAFVGAQSTAGVAASASCDDRCGGFHIDTAGIPNATVIVVPNGDWMITASHELMEMLADPTGAGLEVCDPVESVAYVYETGRATVVLSDFVTPSYFDHGAPPYDIRGALAQPRVSADP